MSEVRCDKCSGMTKPKMITSKKTQRSYTVYECLSGCMNGKWAYTCFAPRGSESPKTPYPPGIPAQRPNVAIPGEDMSSVILLIKAQLSEILFHVKQLKPKVNEDADDLEPNETPF